MVDFNDSLSEFAKIKVKLGKLKAKKEVTVTNITALTKFRKESFELTNDQAAARAVLQEVAQQTQDNLKYKLSSLVTIAMQSIFDGPASFEVVIEQRRNQTELDFFVNEFDILQEPLESSGHGLVDIISLALRISYWSLKKNRKTFILDEPFRNLSRDHSVSASKMLKMLCDKLELQIIMVSHDTEITNFADKIFHVSKTGKKSIVEVK